MKISLIVYTDWKRFLSIEKSWNCLIENSSENPFLFSRLVSKFMEYWISVGWTPLIFTFWSNDKLVGIMPLKMKKKRYTTCFNNLANELFSDFVFVENYAGICINELIDYLFKHLSCRSGNLILLSSSPYINLIKIILKKKGFYQSYSHFMGKAVISKITSWDEFYGNVKTEVKKGLRRRTRRLDELGSWRISCVNVDSNSIDKIHSVEKASWKKRWRELYNVEKDYKLDALLEVCHSDSKVKPIFGTKVCFLELRERTIAYHLVVNYKNRIFFTKTSYNDEFKKLSPGNLLIKTLIQKSFQNRNLKEIDFITDLPFHKIWNPKSKPRTKLTIQNSLLLYIITRTGLFFLKMPSEKSLVIKRLKIKSLLIKIFSKLDFNF